MSVANVILPPVPIVQVPTSRERATGLRWKLYERWVGELDGVRWEVREGFEFNFASVPRLFWFFRSPWDYGDVPPFLHDFGYHWQGRFPLGAVTPHRNWTKAEIDALFLRVMEMKGVPKWRRYAAYYAVRCFGCFAWRSDGRTSEDLRDYAASWQEAS